MSRVLFQLTAKRRISRIRTALGQCGLLGNRGGCWGTLPSIFSQPTAQISRLFVWGWVPWETNSETLRCVCKRFIGINSGGKGKKQDQAEGGADLRCTLNRSLSSPQRRLGKLHGPPFLNWGKGAWHLCSRGKVTGCWLPLPSWGIHGLGQSHSQQPAAREKQRTLGTVRGPHRLQLAHRGPKQTCGLHTNTSTPPFPRTGPRFGFFHHFLDQNSWAQGAYQWQLCFDNGTDFSPAFLQGYI